MNEYICVTRCYIDDRLYKEGDILRVPAGQTYNSPHFELHKEAKVPKAESKVAALDTEPKAKAKSK